MIKRVKFPVSSLRGLVASGILAGAVGLGITQADDYGTPKSSPSGTPTEDQSGTGGSQGPGMTTGETAALPPNVAPGWKLRVCSEKTKAQSINFKITPAEQKGASARGKTKTMGTEAQDQATGMGEGTEKEQAATPGQGQGQEMATWNKGEASVISVPGTLSSAERIRIEATPTEKDAKAEVCVLYNDHVAKKLSFNDREVSTIRTTENATCGC